MEDKYNWEAEYYTGSVLRQIEDDGTKNAYADIDREKLVAFSLIDNTTREKKLVLIFDGDGEKLVWTRRRYFDNTVERPPMHVLGKKGEFILVLNYDGVVAARRNFHQDGIFDEVIQ